MWDDLTKIYNLFGGGQGAASIAVGSIALIGAVSGIVTSYIVAGRSVYINSITAERSKWIEKLRTNIAAYSGGLAAVTFKTKTADFIKNRDDIIALRDQLDVLNENAAKIQLQLNPWGEIDNNIMAIIGAIIIRKTTATELVDRADKLLIEHSQWLLKAEWEKVKFEARSPIYRLTLCCSAWIRRRNYNKWVATKGAIDGIVAEFAIEKAKPTAR